MPTELKFDEKTARALVSTAPKMKPIGVSRAYRVDARFQIGESATSASPGDYIVLNPKGKVVVLPQSFIETNFEPVKKRTTKPKGKTDADNH